MYLYDIFSHLCAYLLLQGQKPQPKFVIMKTFVWLAAGLLLFTAFTKQKAAQLLNFRIGKVDATIQGINLIIVVSVIVQNPSGQTFNVRSLSGNLYLNDDFIGNVSSFQQREVKANTETSYPVTITMSFIGVALEIYDLIKNFTGVNVKLTGTANVDGVAIPVNVNYKLV